PARGTTARGRDDRVIGQIGCSGGIGRATRGAIAFGSCRRARAASPSSSRWSKFGHYSPNYRTRNRLQLSGFWLGGGAFRLLLWLPGWEVSTVVFMVIPTPTRLAATTRKIADFLPRAARPSWGIPWYRGFHGEEMNKCCMTLRLDAETH